MKSAWGLLGLVLLWPAHAQDAQKAVTCLQSNVLPASQVQEIELESTDIHGEKRLLKGKLFSTREDLPESKGLLRAALKIRSPDYLAGAAYLLRQTEDRRFDSTYVYLPSVRRARRVSAEFSDGALLGTHFSYYEFKALASAFGDLTPKLEGTAKYEDRTVDVISFTAKPGDALALYSAVKVRIDQKACVALMAEFYKGDTVRKRFSASPKALKKTRDFWYLSEVEMRDVLDDTYTTLRVTSLKTVDSLPSRHFDPNTFYLGD